MQEIAEMTEKELIGAYQASSNEREKSLYSTELLNRNDRLIRHYSRLMRDRYEQYSDRMEWEDLYQECRIGYLEAIGKFDNNSTKKLSSYAYFWMLQKSRRYFEKHGRLIKHGFQTLDTSIAKIKASYENLGLEVPEDAYDHLFKTKSKKEAYWHFKATSTGKALSIEQLESDSEMSFDIESVGMNPADRAVLNEAINPITFVLKTFTYSDAKTIANNAKIELKELGLTEDSFPKKVSYPKIKGCNRINQLNEEFRQRLQLTNYNKTDLMEVFAS